MVEPEVESDDEPAVAVVADYDFGLDHVKKRHDGYPLWPDPLGEMPDDDPLMPSKYRWTPEKWQAYVLRHKNYTWPPIWEEMNRDRTTVMAWFRNLRIRYGPRFASRRVKTPESARNIPGYARSALTAEDEFELLAAELRDVLDIGQQILTKSLRLKLEDPVFLKAMEVKDLKDLATMMDTIGKRHDALRDPPVRTKSLPAGPPAAAPQVNIFQKFDEAKVGDATQQASDLRTLLSNFKDRKGDAKQGTIEVFESETG